MKISVYTIALNELNFTERWVNSVREADYLLVADTGSMDGTQQALKNLGVQVYDIGVKPWRFDDARNVAMSLLPHDADVCLSMDMDELMAPGWRQELESVWTPETTRLRYTYVHSFDANDQPMITYSADKCHARWGYRWNRPVHETVFAVGDETTVTNMNVTMWQKQDINKSRGQYLPLLELSHKENSDCAQTLFWLAREYAYQNQQENAINHFKKFIQLPHAWSTEKSEAERWLSKLLPNDKVYWLRQSVASAPYRREPWLDLADHYYHTCDWINCWAMSAEAIGIKHKTGSYLDMVESWGAKPYDLAGIACWNLGLREKSAEYFQQAVDINPNDDRIRQNLEIVKSQIGQ